MHHRSQASRFWLAACLLLAATTPATHAQNSANPQAYAAAVKIGEAAKAFLATLDEAARAKTVFAADDAAQRVNWSNLPTGIYQRKGARLGSLNQTQKDAAMAVLAAALSKQGYEKVQGIIDADESIKKSAPGNLVFGADEFYLSFVGAPSATERWTIQFGGHHLALNITIVGDQGVLTPSHTAAQPASFTLNGKTIRPLGGENDKAFALINALDADQQKQAILGAQFRDLVLGPGNDGKMIQPEGIKGSALKADQQAMLLSLAGEWAGMMNDASAAVKMAEIKAGLPDTWFAWSGPTKNGSAAYFRIQGPTVFIEYAPQNLGGNATQHIHTIFRDPTNEYGRKFTAR